MLRAYVIEFEGSWDKHLALVEFAYNNNNQSSIGMPPYGALYGRKCRTPLCWSEAGLRKFLGPDIMQQTEDKVKIIKDRLKIASDRQKSYADLKRREIEHRKGDKVFLKVSMLKKYRSDPSHVLRIESIEINPDLTYEEEPIQILTREIKEIRKKKIPLVKFLWRNHSGKEATWEREEDMQIQYPHLFQD
ncbi:uncharacterized protein LOC132624142 [Lycium barbarum]|uniref:uncharacterized protein LOC132624142 n=1 Tax=Lycium barbarum TaxID=112863 RepID=UPI00293F794B|nr:uncharacterized protein LOC132624142 [Lycium barbarum]